MADWSKAPKWANVLLRSEDGHGQAWVASCAEGTRAQYTAGGTEFRLSTLGWAVVSVRDVPPAEGAPVAWGEAPEWAGVKVTRIADGATAWAEAYRTGSRAQHSGSAQPFELTTALWAVAATRGGPPADWSKAPKWANVLLAQHVGGGLAWASALADDARAQRTTGGPEFELIARYWALLETRGAPPEPAEDLAEEWHRLDAEVSQRAGRMAEIREELARRGLDVCR